MKTKFLLFALTVIFSTDAHASFLERVDSERSAPARARSVVRMKRVYRPIEEKSAIELRTAPLALIASWGTLDAAYRFHPQFSIGPAVVLYNGEKGNMFLPGYKGTALGLNATFYFTPGYYSAWYMSTHVFKEKFTSRSTEAVKDTRTEKDLVRANAAIGYHWKWQHFNMRAGAGPELRSGESKKFLANKLEKDSNVSDVLPHVEFKLGWDI